MVLTAAQGRRLARLNGLARTALGVVALVAPGVPLAPWVGPAAQDPTSRLLARALGGRDLALGLGTLRALRRGEPIVGWVAAGGLADAGDVLATARHFSSLPRGGRWAVLAAASGGTVAAVITAMAGDP